MGITIPKIKKKITSFLVGEEGKISKKSIFKVGIVLGTAALSSALVAAEHSNFAPHTNSLSGSEHQHMLSHSSHGSHGSHGHHSNCHPGSC